MSFSGENPKTAILAETPDYASVDREVAGSIDVDAELRKSSEAVMAEVSDHLSRSLSKSAVTLRPFFEYGKQVQTPLDKRALQVILQIIFNEGKLKTLFENVKQTEQPSAQQVETLKRLVLDINKLHEELSRLRDEKEKVFNESLKNEEIALYLAKPPNFENLRAEFLIAKNSAESTTVELGTKGEQICAQLVSKIKTLRQLVQDNQEKQDDVYHKVQTVWDQVKELDSELNAVLILLPKYAETLATASGDSARQESVKSGILEGTMSGPETTKGIENISTDQLIANIEKVESIKGLLAELGSVDSVTNLGNKERERVLGTIRETCNELLDGSTSPRKEKYKIIIDRSIGSLKGDDPSSLVRSREIVGNLVNEINNNAGTTAQVEQPEPNEPQPPVEPVAKGVKTADVPKAGNPSPDAGNDRKGEERRVNQQPPTPPATKATPSPDSPNSASVEKDKKPKTPTLEQLQARARKLQELLSDLGGKNEISEAEAKQALRYAGIALVGVERMLPEGWSLESLKEELQKRLNSAESKIQQTQTAREAFVQSIRSASNFSEIEGTLDTLPDGVLTVEQFEALKDRARELLIDSKKGTEEDISEEKANSRVKFSLGSNKPTDIDGIKRVLHNMQSELVNSSAAKTSGKNLNKNKSESVEKKAGAVENGAIANPFERAKSISDLIRISENLDPDMSAEQFSSLTDAVQRVIAEVQDKEEVNAKKISSNGKREKALIRANMYRNILNNFSRQAIDGREVGDAQAVVEDLKKLQAYIENRRKKQKFEEEFPLNNKEYERFRDQEAYEPEDTVGTIEGDAVRGYVDRSEAVNSSNNKSPRELDEEPGGDESDEAISKAKRRVKEWRELREKKVEIPQSALKALTTELFRGDDDLSADEVRERVKAILEEADINTDAVSYFLEDIRDDNAFQAIQEISKELEERHIARMINLQVELDVATNDKREKATAGRTSPPEPDINPGTPGGDPPPPQGPPPPPGEPPAEPPPQNPETPYEKTKEEWKRIREQSEQMTKRYDESLRAFYKKHYEEQNGRSTFNPTKWKMATKDFFGIKPPLTPELDQMRNEEQALRGEYFALGERLIQERPGRESLKVRQNDNTYTETSDPAELALRREQVAERYRRMLDRKILTGTIEKRQGLQIEALKSVPQKRTLVTSAFEVLSKNKKKFWAARIGAAALVAGATGGIGAGLLAGGAVAGRIAAAVGVGAGAGWASGRLDQSVKESNLNAIKGKHIDSLSLEEFHRRESELVEAFSEVDKAKRNKKIATIAAGLAFGGASLTYSLMDTADAAQIPSRSGGGNSVPTGQGAEVTSPDVEPDDGIRISGADTPKMADLPSGEHLNLNEIEEQLREPSEVLTKSDLSSAVEQLTEKLQEIGDRTDINRAVLEDLKVQLQEFPGTVERAIIENNLTPSEAEVVRSQVASVINPHEGLLTQNEILERMNELQNSTADVPALSEAQRSVVAEICQEMRDDGLVDAFEKCNAELEAAKQANLVLDTDAQDSGFEQPRDTTMTAQERDARLAYQEDLSKVEVRDALPNGDAQVAQMSTERANARYLAEGGDARVAEFSQLRERIGDVNAVNRSGPSAEVLANPETIPSVEYKVTMPKYDSVAGKGTVSNSLYEAFENGEFDDVEGLPTDKGEFVHRMNVMINKANADPALLEQMGIDSGDINLVKEGQKVDLGPLVERMANPEAFQTAAPAQIAPDTSPAETVESANVESARTQPSESPVPEPKPAVSARAEMSIPAPEELARLRELGPVLDINGHVVDMTTEQRYALNQQWSSDVDALYEKHNLKPSTLSTNEGIVFGFKGGASRMFDVVKPNMFSGTYSVSEMRVGTSPFAAQENIPSILKMHEVVMNIGEELGYERPEIETIARQLPSDATPNDLAQAMVKEKLLEDFQIQSLRAGLDSVSTSTGTKSVNTSNGLSAERNPAAPGQPQDLVDRELFEEPYGQTTSEAQRVGQDLNRIPAKDSVDAGGGSMLQRAVEVSAERRGGVSQEVLDEALRTVKGNPEVYKDPVTGVTDPDKVVQLIDNLSESEKYSLEGVSNTPEVDIDSAVVAKVAGVMDNLRPSSGVHSETFKDFMDTPLEEFDRDPGVSSSGNVDFRRTTTTINGVFQTEPRTPEYKDLAEKLKGEGYPEAHINNFLVAIENNHVNAPSTARMTPNEILAAAAEQGRLREMGTINGLVAPESVMYSENILPPERGFRKIEDALGEPDRELVRSRNAEGGLERDYIRQDDTASYNEFMQGKTIRELFLQEGGNRDALAEQLTAELKDQGYDSANIDRLFGFLQNLVDSTSGAQIREFLDWNVEDTLKELVEKGKVSFNRDGTINFAHNNISTTLRK